MDQQAQWIESDTKPEVPLGVGVEAITQGIAGWIEKVLAIPPAEPCDESNFGNIPLREWRRALQEWCHDPFVRRAYGSELTRGLAMSLDDFDDATLMAFLESVI